VDHIPKPKYEVLRSCEKGSGALLLACHVSVHWGKIHSTGSPPRLPPPHALLKSNVCVESKMSFIVQAQRCFQYTFSRVKSNTRRRLWVSPLRTEPFRFAAKHFVSSHRIHVDRVPRSQCQSSTVAGPSVQRQNFSSPLLLLRQIIWDAAFHLLES
jgi:hypothetical protein